MQEYCLQQCLNFNLLSARMMGNTYHTNMTFKNILFVSICWALKWFVANNTRVLSSTQWFYFNLPSSGMMDNSYKKNMISIIISIPWILKWFVANSPKVSYIFFKCVAWKNTNLIITAQGSNIFLYFFLWPCV